MGYNWNLYWWCFHSRLRLSVKPEGNKSCGWHLEYTWPGPNIFHSASLPFLTHVLLFSHDVLFSPSLLSGCYISFLPSQLSWKINISLYQLVWLIQCEIQCVWGVQSLEDMTRQAFAKPSAVSFSITAWSSKQGLGILLKLNGVQGYIDVH